VVPIEFFASTRFDIDNEMEEEQSSWSPNDSDSFSVLYQGIWKVVAVREAIQPL